MAEEQKNLEEDISPLTEQQKKYLGVLKDKVGNEKYSEIKTKVLGGFDYSSVQDGSKVIEELKKELNISSKPEKLKPSIDDYIAFEQLLEEAHKRFEKLSIKTEVMVKGDSDGKKLEELLNSGFVVKAVVKTEKGIYTAYGDATPENTTKIVKDALLRMAETRAVARALRFATGIGKTLKEELVESEKDEK